MSDAARPGRQRGFTLIELLLVTALLATIAAFSWPAIGRSFDRSQHLAVAGKLHELLAEARSHAIELGRPHLVRVDSQNGRLDVWEVHFDEVTSASFADPGSAAMAAPRRSSSRTVAEGTGQTALLDGGPRPVSAGPGDAGSSDDGPLGKPAGAWEAPDGFYLSRPARPDQLHDSFSELLVAPQGLSEDQVAGGLPDVTGQAFSRDGTPAGLDETAAGLATPVVWQFVFDVLGRTRDQQLWLHDRNGYYVSLKIEGTSGEITPGERRKSAVRTEDRLAETDG